MFQLHERGLYCHFKMESGVCIKNVLQFKDCVLAKPLLDCSKYWLTAQRRKEVTSANADSLT